MTYIGLKVGRGRVFSIGLLVAAAIGSGTPRAVHAASGSSVYRKLLPKTVWIRVRRPDRSVVTGSGFVAARTQTSYYIVTNHHVVRNPTSPLSGAFVSKVKIYHPKMQGSRAVNDRNRYTRSDWGIDGSVLYTRPEKDLAIIGVAGKPPSGAWPYSSGTTRIPTRSVQPGDAVFSVGNPGASGGLWTYSSGEVRQSYRKYGREIVETTSPINPGDSGGPLVDSEGYIVGVNTSYRVNARLVSHAVAASEVRRTLYYAKTHGWFWLKNLNNVPTSRYPAVIAYYEKVGHLHWAATNVRGYLKRLRKEGKPTAKWSQKLKELTSMQKSTGRQCYVRFENKTNETIDVFYRIYSLTGNLDRYQWYPESSDRWYRKRMKPNSSAFIRGADGRPVPVSRYTTYARGTKGSSWRRRTRSLSFSTKTFPSFATATATFNGR